jgi:hypothetical protein
VQFALITVQSSPSGRICRDASGAAGGAARFRADPAQSGAPRPQDVDASRQALDALFGGPAPRSAVETDTLGKAGPSSPAIRSTVGDPKTQTVPKGAGVRDILKTPEGSSAAAHAGTGQ